jgi:hypothetical protein
MAGAKKTQPTLSERHGNKRAGVLPGGALPTEGKHVLRAMAGLRGGFPAGGRTSAAPPPCYCENACPEAAAMPSPRPLQTLPGCPKRRTLHLGRQGGSGTLFVVFTQVVFLSLV